MIVEVSAPTPATMPANQSKETNLEITNKLFDLMSLYTKFSTVQVCAEFVFPSAPAANCVSMFFAGWDNDASAPLNTVTIIDTNGALVVAEYNVGTDRDGLGGAGIGSKGLFFGGIYNALGNSANLLTIIESSTSSLAVELTLSTIPKPFFPVGVSLASLALFYSGNDTTTVYNSLFRVNATGNLLGAVLNVGTNRTYAASATLETLGLFYGGYGNARLSTYINAATLLDSNGTLVGSETNIGTPRAELAGAGVSGVGVFIGGYNSNYTAVDTLTLINDSGAIVGTEIASGLFLTGGAGAGVADTGIFYAGDITNSESTMPTNSINRIDSTGAAIGSAISNGTVRDYLTGTKVCSVDFVAAPLPTLPANIGIFFGGYISANDGDNYTNLVTRIDSTGAMVGTETNVGTLRRSLGGVPFDTFGLFFAGEDSTFSATDVITRIDAYGAIIDTETNYAGTNLYEVATGARVDTVGIFYGLSIDAYINGTSTSNVLSIDNTGTKVGTETNVGTARYGLGGAGLNTVGVFYGGLDNTTNNIVKSIVTLIDSTQAIVGTELSVGTARQSVTGVPMFTTTQNLAIFYGGLDSDFTDISEVTRIDANGTLVGSEVQLGAGGNSMGGAGIDTSGMFYAGHDNYSNIDLNNTVAIDFNGAQIGIETTVGTNRTNLAGAGIYTGSTATALTTPPIATSPTYSTYSDPMTGFAYNLGVFYGGSDNVVNLNTVTSIDNTGAQFGTDSNVGTARSNLAGAGINNKSLFVGGQVFNTTSNSMDYFNTLTVIDQPQTLIGSEINLGIAAKAYLAGVGMGSNAFYFGGFNNSNFNTLTVVNNIYALISNNSSLGTARSNLAGANIGYNAMFYGGNTNGIQGNPSQIVTQFDGSQNLVGTETNVGTPRFGLAGAGVSTIAMFYGGQSGTSPINNLTIIASNNTAAAIDINLGTARYNLAGAGLGSVGVFYGGYGNTDVTGIVVNLVTLINNSGTLIGAELTVGTAKLNLAASGIVGA